MTTIDEEKLEIHLSETFSFEHDVVPKLEEAVDELKERVALGVEDKDEEEDIKKFLVYTLTQEDKVKILKNVVEDYYRETYRGDCEVSLFDEDGINRGINQWIEEKFKFSWL